MKKDLFLIFIFISALQICEAQTLSEMSTEGNKHLPQIYSNFITIERTSFRNNVFSFYFTIELGSAYNFTNFHNHPSLSKEYAKLWTISMYKADPYMFNRMIDKKVSEAICVYDKSHNLNVTFTLTPDDLKSMINKYYKMNDNLISLKMQEVSTKCQVPINIDFCTTLVDANLTSTYFEYKYEINDSKLDFNLIKTKGFKDSMINNINKMPKALLETIVAISKTNRSLKLTYTGQYSKDSYSFYITSQELKEALK